ncbi:MAG: amidohydrolase family protein [Pseudolabrys sp.]|nr:amidohydrolase family protein [Pseudolabrys sp.]MDP2295120.1 amidohydrolase family protein [Pseudolabrys sp.]
MRFIALEEHFTTPVFLDGPGRAFVEGMLKSGGPAAAKIVAQLADIGGGRIAEMDEAGLDMQVLSLNSPGVEQSDPDEAIAVARDANDVLAAAVRQHPTRFVALAALPVGAPAAAADELERCVRNGFKGANINGHSRGRYLDDAFYAPILERAEALNVPIYLHPTMPPKAVMEASYGGFHPAATFLIAGAGWGWHIETATHIMRMMLGGVFDRFPKLQVVIGHMGEALPFMMPRMEELGARLPSAAKPQRPLGDYLRRNLHYTFGGFNYAATFQNLIANVGPERIMFSVDYPYGSMKEARAFLEKLPISELDRARIAHGNAERLLGV